MVDYFVLVDSYPCCQIKGSRSGLPLDMAMDRDAAVDIGVGEGRLYWSVTWQGLCSTIHVSQGGNGVT